MKSIWSQEQIEFLKQNYETLKTEQLISILKDKSNDQIRWKAKEFKLKKKVTCSKSDISFLENFDDPESLYWWGFLTADGCITPKQIIFSLEDGDKEHVIKFAEKCNSSVKYVTKINSWHKQPYTMARTVINDIFTIKRLIEKLKIKPKKTYNPFDISVFLTKDRLKYYLAGLIDGDGNINTKSSYQIRIKVHPNWKPNFDLISSHLRKFYDIDSNSSFSSQGWALLSIGKKENLRKLFEIIELKIPIMTRKWDKIKNLG